LGSGVAGRPATTASVLIDGVAVETDGGAISIEVGDDASASVIIVDRTIDATRREVRASPLKGATAAGWTLSPVAVNVLSEMMECLRHRRQRRRGAGVDISGLTGIDGGTGTNTLSLDGVDSSLSGPVDFAGFDSPAQMTSSTISFFSADVTGLSLEVDTVARCQAACRLAVTWR
jgi:hypothetical protein